MDSERRQTRLALRAFELSARGDAVAAPIGARYALVMTASVAQVWEWLEGVPDPEIPAISIVDLGIVRDVAWSGDELRVAITPTYSGCPATSMIQRDIVSALARTRFGSRAARCRTFTALDDGGHLGERSRQTARVRDRATEPGHRRRLPALRFDGGRMYEHVRLDAVQVAVPLHGLPRTVRSLQVPLAGRS